MAAVTLHWPNGEPTQVNPDSFVRAFRRADGWTAVELRGGGDRLVCIESPDAVAKMMSDPSLCPAVEAECSGAVMEQGRKYWLEYQDQFRSNVKRSARRRRDAEKRVSWWSRWWHGGRRQAVDARCERLFGDNAWPMYESEWRTAFPTGVPSDMQEEYRESRRFYDELARICGGGACG